jgi:DNA-binding NtrC family response regulator
MTIAMSEMRRFAGSTWSNAGGKPIASHLSVTPILVVDDEQSMLAALREYLGERGYRVDCARELEEAQALLTKFRYSAVITDLHMTSIHGDEGLHLVDEIRERSPATRVVLITGFGSQEVYEEAIRRGADVVLAKPLPLAQLARITDELVGQ